MKILIINYEYPPLGGGAGKQTELLGEYLSKNHQVTILTSGWNTSCQTINSNLTIQRIWVNRKYTYKVRIIELILFIIFGTMKGLSLSKKEKYQVTISFFAVPSGIISLILKILYRIPYIVSFRGFDVPGHLSKEYGFWQKLMKPFIKLILLKSKFAVANSQHLKKIINKLDSNKNILVIPNAVKGINNLKIKKNKLINILSIGRLTMLKGFDDLVVSVSKIPKDKFSLEIIGDGPYRNKIEKVIKSTRMQKNIKISGWINRNNIKKKYEKAEIFVFLSKEEGMSNVLLEAVSYGLPVIALDIMPNRAIVKNNINGFLIKKNELEEIKTKIELLIKDKNLRKKMSSNSLLISKEFAPNKVFYRWDNLLKNLV